MENILKSFKTSGIFLKSFLMFFYELFVMYIGVSGCCLYTLGFLRPVRNGGGIKKAVYKTYQYP
jgi:hypothetical protein